MWKISTLHIILDNLPSLCQKLSDLVEVWRSYNKNNFACFFETRCIVTSNKGVWGESGRNWLGGLCYSSASWRIFRLWMLQNAFAVGTPPRTSLRSLQRSPVPLPPHRHRISALSDDSHSFEESTLLTLANYCSCLCCGKEFTFWMYRHSFIHLYLLTNFAI